MTESETPQQRRLRIYKEQGARKKVKPFVRPEAKASLRKKYKDSSQELSSELLATAEAAKASRQKVAKEKADRLAEKMMRRRLKICICCGDEFDSEKFGYCNQCFNEKAYGTIRPPGVSERQLKSMACRNVRKGLGMS